MCTIILCFPVDCWIQDQLLQLPLNRNSVVAHEQGPRSLGTASTWTSKATSSTFSVYFYRYKVAFAVFPCCNYTGKSQKLGVPR